MRSRSIIAGLAATLIAVLALSGSSIAGGIQNPPQPGPSDFVRKVDNPFFPLTPGTTYIYRGVKDAKPTRDVFRVTKRKAVIQGVATVVVRDDLYQAGKLAETTIDWFAQDRSGNVWYFGEDTKELDPNGNVISTEGTWKAGVDGARAGVVMPATPRVGDSYRQEFYKGHAEDHFRITSLSARVTVPYGSFRKVLKTREWTPLDPAIRENKYYARGIGLVRGEDVKGPAEHSDLVSIQRSR
jgi:hypothetical protein